MDNIIHRIIIFAFPILTPGVMVLAVLVTIEILDEKITLDKLGFALVIFVLWAVTFYYYKKLKRK